MTSEELDARVRASRNQPAVAERSAAEPPEIEPEPRAQRLGLRFLAACCLPWLPLLWWILTR